MEKLIVKDYFYPIFMYGGRARACHYLNHSVSCLASAYILIRLRNHTAVVVDSINQ